MTYYRLLKAYPVRLRARRLRLQEGRVYSTQQLRMAGLLPVLQHQAEIRGWLERVPDEEVNAALAAQESAVKTPVDEAPDTTRDEADAPDIEAEASVEPEIEDEAGDEEAVKALWPKARARGWKRAQLAEAVSVHGIEAVRAAIESEKAEEN